MWMKKNQKRLRLITTVTISSFQNISGCDTPQDQMHFFFQALGTLTHMAEKSSHIKMKTERQGS